MTHSGEAGSPALAELSEVARLRAERDHLEARRAQARTRLAELEARVPQARDAAVRESADVRRLEQLSLTRILAGLRGNLEAELDREKAEAQGAEYAHVTAVRRVEEARAEEARLTREIVELGDLGARQQAALAAREAEIRTAAGQGAQHAFADVQKSRRLDEIADRQGVIAADRKEVDEALEACAYADRALVAAHRELKSAGGYATYDTFFGGGMFADMVKHSKLDRAAAMIRDADTALSHLATELADVGLGPVGGIGISELSRMFDLWFDNIFSDWAVANRITDARRRVEQAIDAVRTTDAELRRRGTALHREAQDLTRERERMLAG